MIKAEIYVGLSTDQTKAALQMRRQWRGMNMMMGVLLSTAQVEIRGQANSEEFPRQRRIIFHVINPRRTRMHSSLYHQGLFHARWPFNIYKKKQQ